jgi:membrane-associated phospholipid phosphatase
MLMLVFVSVARSALAKREKPLVIAWNELKPRVGLFAWCLLGFPLYMAAYSAVKSGIGPITGFNFDPLFTNVDAAIFGEDAWKPVHAIIGPFASVVDFLYFNLWVSMLFYATPLAAAFASRERAAVLIVARTATWFVGGVILAYALNSTGPIFVHLVDPDLGTRFAPLRSALLNELPDGAMFVRVPAYLEYVTRSGSGAFGPGGGISAMPSMHVAQAVLYVMFARRTKLLWPSVAFALIIYLGSVYSGLHYAIDGIVAGALAVLCWKLSEWWVQDRTEVSREFSTMRLSQDKAGPLLRNSDFSPPA